MAFFLSYAHEDSEIGGMIAAWLREHGHDVHDWLDPGQRGGRFMARIEKAIRDADAFFAVLSPSFMASNWCRREREMALQVDQYLQAGNAGYEFIHVLMIENIQPVDTGFLGGYDWVDLTDRRLLDTRLSELMSRLGSADRLTAGRPDRVNSDLAIDNSDPAAPMFRNRQDELVRVIRGLANAAGPHFWLVIAPPQLGKTWFVKRVAADISKADSVEWVTRLVDMRAEPPEALGDVAAMLERIFALEEPVTVGPDTFRRIAQGIARSGMPHLVVLDNAELLDEKTAASLRSCLSHIHRLVRDAGRPGVRLGLIVASRRDDEWRGVTPEPRLTALPLTEFKPDVVQQALADLALEMHRTFASVELAKIAAAVYRLSEGLPAVLARCLEWIREQEWLGLDRLEGRAENQELFAELAGPYIRDGLLTRDSLYPQREGPADAPLQMLKQAYRALVPYRLFTQSHLRHQRQLDTIFQAAMDGVPWSMEDLWKAISGTALLTRPLSEPWQEIYPAIRRLLHRYYYTTDAERADAHRRARQFLTIWGDQQTGKEQVIGLVECLWHEAIVLQLESPGDMAQMLSQSAADLSAGIRPSLAYSPDELRSFAAELMRNDGELEDVVSSVPGLFARLAEIVLMPLQES